jgi:uncharacterized protein YaiE (UPF0345 family)
MNEWIHPGFFVESNACKVIDKLSRQQGGIRALKSGEGRSEYLLFLNKKRGGIMSEFKNVTVAKKANIYFGGSVTSRDVKFADGSKKTLGVMLPGEYTFSTDFGEIMEILTGDMDVLLPGEQDWQKIQGGESFTIPPRSEFSLNVRSVVDYCCSYIEN